VGIIKNVAKKTRFYGLAMQSFAFQKLCGFSHARGNVAGSEEVISALQIPKSLFFWLGFLSGLCAETMKHGGH
jgi:hypothetical protein